MALAGAPNNGALGNRDPAEAEDLAQREAFKRAMIYLRNRINLFLALPVEELDRMSLRRPLREIGQMSEGASLTAQEGSAD